VSESTSVSLPVFARMYASLIKKILRGERYPYKVCKFDVCTMKYTIEFSIETHKYLTSLRFLKQKS